VSTGDWRVVVLGTGALVAILAGCAAKRIEQGVFYSPKGYHVALPGPDWQVVESTDADLELRHRTAPAGIFVHATCEERAARAPAPLLARRLVAGLRDREVLERDEVVVAGRVARRTVVEGRPEGAAAPLRIETYVMTDGACVYDLAYAAPPAVFGPGRGDFARLAATLRVGR
jgi:hypothetical protein